MNQLKLIWLMQNDIFKKDFEPKSDVGLYEILVFLQSIAEAHADQMGIGYEEMVRTQAFWVLSRQKLIIHKWPTHSKLTVFTWSRPLHGISATRDFEIYQNDEKIAESTTRWMVLDATTRRPTRPQLDYTKAVTRKNGVLPFEAEKVEAVNDASLHMNYQVQVSDLDYNNHVNNTKYTLWVINSFLDKNKLQNLKEYDINFLNETNLGDHVDLQVKEIENGIIFQGVNSSKKNVLFTTRMKF